jgi:hypothetical protein
MKEIIQELYEKSSVELYHWSHSTLRGKYYPPILESSYNDFNSDKLKYIFDYLKYSDDKICIDLLRKFRLTIRDLLFDYDIRLIDNSVYFTADYLFELLECIYELKVVESFERLYYISNSDFLLGKETSNGDDLLIQSLKVLFSLDIPILHKENLKAMCLKFLNFKEYTRISYRCLWKLDVSNGYKLLPDFAKVTRNEDIEIYSESVKHYFIKNKAYILNCNIYKFLLESSNDVLLLKRIGEILDFIKIFSREYLFLNNSTHLTPTIFDIQLPLNHIADFEEVYKYFPKDVSKLQLDKLNVKIINSPN